MKTCRSDIYECETCGGALEYAVNEDGERLDDSPLVCSLGWVTYRVDMATGVLVRADEPVPADWPVP